jgi:hypothetical protein
MKQLFDRWYNAEENTVATFNKIFDRSKIEGFDSSKEVFIGEMLVGGLREVFIGDEILRIELRGQVVIDKPEKVLKYQYVNGKATKESRRKGLYRADNAEVSKDDLSDIEKINKKTVIDGVSGNYLKVLMLIRKVKTVQGTKFIAEKLDISHRTTRYVVDELEKRKLIRREQVSNFKIIHAV